MDVGGAGRLRYAGAAEAGAFCMLGLRTPPMLALEGFGHAARLPGARGACLEAEGRDKGIEISGAIVAELGALGGRVGIAFPG